MKNLLLLSLLFITITGCDNFKANYYNPTDTDDLTDKKIVIIDTCEYIQYRTYSGYFDVTHKGNCKHCQQRKNQTK